jgi:hypothetical protein
MCPRCLHFYEECVCARLVHRRTLAGRSTVTVPGEPAALNTHFRFRFASASSYTLVGAVKAKRYSVHTNSAEWNASCQIGTCANWLGEILDALSIYFVGTLLLRLHF